LWRLDQEHRLESQYATALISALGQFKTRPSAAKIFRSIYGRGFLSEYETEHASRATSKEEEVERLRALTARARERYKHLPGRGQGTFRVA